MLWEKESKKDGFYVDVFALNGGRAVLNEALRPLRCESKTATFTKNDAISLQRRKQGNERFGASGWNEAMEIYNASLRYAENGSPNISLAYANRSACFLKMKRYNECLIDIELAKEAGYPAHLMDKLEQRKVECVKAIEAGAPSVNVEPKLSFAHDDKFPCMANVLKIQRDDDGELTVIATEDIAVGQTVVMEKAFMTLVLQRNGFKCNICLKEFSNLMPCQKCTVAMFCSEKCQRNPLHQHECGLKLSIDTDTNNSLLRQVRSCLLGIGLFADKNELMEFVERSIRSDRYEMPTLLSDAKSQYKMFLKLPIPPNSTIHGAITCIVLEVYNVLMNMPHINSMFNCEKSRRFLVHLIGHHYYILEHNSTLAGTRRLHPTDFQHQIPVYISSQVGLITQYFKHSCAPNQFVCSFHGNNVMTTVRPVKKGEPLTYSYLLIMTEPKEERQKALWERKRFICSCSLCNGVSASPMQRNQLTSDPDFQYIVSNFSVDNSDDPDLQKITDKCKQFLQKYGQFSWCIEIGKVIQIYIHLINIRYRGTISVNSYLYTI